MNQVSLIAKDAERMDQSNRIGETAFQELTDTTQVDEGVKTGQRSAAQLRLNKAST
jgi:hypothetical protein